MWWLLKHSLSSFIFLLLTGCSSEQPSFDFQEGDVILQALNSAQCDAVREATDSYYSHCGIVLEDGGELVVFQAIGPVLKSSLSGFTESGIGGHYVVLRPKSKAGLDMDKVKDYCTGELGKPYDIYFAWDDSEQYCSELVWKAYNAGGLKICNTRPLGDYDLESTLVKAVMQERYGDSIPLEEPMVAPGDLLDSEILVVVFENGEVKQKTVKSDGF